MMLDDDEVEAYLDSLTDEELEAILAKPDQPSQNCSQNKTRRSKNTTHASAEPALAASVTDAGSTRE